MPVKSPKQWKFMSGISHGMKPRGGMGPSKEVAEEMVNATPANKISAFSKALSKRRKK